MVSKRLIIFAKLYYAFQKEEALRKKKNKKLRKGEHAKTDSGPVKKKSGCCK